MSYYPPPDGYQGPPPNQGFNNSGSEYPQQQHQQPYGGSNYPQEPSGYPQQGYGDGSGYGAPAGGDYAQHSGGQFQQGGYPQGGSGNFSQQGGYPQQGGYQGGPLPGGFQDPSQVPEEHLPPGYNPQTKRAYEPHEIPRGASPAPEGYEGYVPEGMSHKEAQERGFIGATGGGLLGAWLGHKFGKSHGNHGFLGTLGGAGLGGWLGNKIL